jgi:molybdopterin-guanine dinucleotide biosynthesis protein A
VVPVDTPQVTPRCCSGCRLIKGVPARYSTMNRCRCGCRSMIIAAACCRSLIDDPTARRSLRALQERLGVIRLPLAPEDQALLLNCNTPSEWESITA